jgi:hypothetical protein
MTVPAPLQALAVFRPASTRGLLLLAIVLAVVFSVLLLYALHRILGPRGRRWLIALVTLLGGLFFGLEYFWPARGEPAKNFLTDWIEPVSVMLSVVGAFTIGLGIYSLCQTHGSNVARRRPGWHNSLAFFIAMIAMLVFGSMRSSSTVSSHLCWRPLPLCWPSILPPQPTAPSAFRRAKQ